MVKLFLIVLFTALFTCPVKANNYFFLSDSIKYDSAKTSIVPFFSADSNEVLFVDSIHPSAHKNTKLIAALFAFPLPFGIFGGHRLYFGTKPYMPFVYIATLGGCCGILPLIDFVAILTSGKKDLDRFKNNPRVFMWSK